MARPVVIMVNDDSDVLKSIERDLGRHHADGYRILSANSGAAAGPDLMKEGKRPQGWTGDRDPWSLCSRRSSARLYQTRSFQFRGRLNCRPIRESLSREHVT
jgi:hypothetical protein